jgi:predicted signal transduction protein with EAL and GGDEF domain
MRQADALVRYGGDEFTMILPDTDSRGAHLVLGRMHMLLGKTPFAREGKAIFVSFSAGIAQLTGERRRQKSAVARRSGGLPGQAGRPELHPERTMKRIAIIGLRPLRSKIE